MTRGEDRRRGPDRPRFGSATAAIGGVFTLAALFLPGMRDIEGTGTATEVDAERNSSTRSGAPDLLRPPAFVDVRN